MNESDPRLLFNDARFKNMNKRMIELLEFIERNENIEEMHELFQLIEAYNELIRICEELAGMYMHHGAKEQAHEMVSNIRQYVKAREHLQQKAIIPATPAFSATAVETVNPLHPFTAVQGAKLRLQHSHGDDDDFSFNRLVATDAPMPVFHEDWDGDEMDDGDDRDEQAEFQVETTGPIFQQQDRQGSGQVSKRTIPLCEHGRQKSQCKDCGGGSICEHFRIRSKCNECRGGSVCQHGRIKSTCKECGGSSFCQHGRRRRICKECMGSGICQHGRQRRQCKECGGFNICEHGKRRSTCKECGGSSICQHGRYKYTCKDCGGSSICEHGRQRRICKECGGSGICQHGRRKHICKECRSSQGQQEGGKTRKSKKSYRNVKMSFRKNKKVIAHKKTKRLVKSSSKASSRKSHI
jgi:hypothetical protein